MNNLTTTEDPSTCSGGYAKPKRQAGLGALSVANVRRERFCRKQQSPTTKGATGDAHRL
jgi:hypothetical protein